MKKLLLSACLFVFAVNGVFAQSGAVYCNISNTPTDSAQYWIQSDDHIINVRGSNQNIILPSAVDEDGRELIFYKNQPNRVFLRSAQTFPNQPRPQELIWQNNTMTDTLGSIGVYTVVAINDMWVVTSGIGRGIENYKQIIFKTSQTGSGDPTSSLVYKNTTDGNGNFVFVRTGTGTYKLYNGRLFPSNSLVKIDLNVTDINHSATWEITSGNSITIKTYHGGVLADGILLNSIIDIIIPANYQ